MTVQLIGSQGKTHFTHHSWRLLLSLALQNGWKPAGTLPPADEAVTWEQRVIENPPEGSGPRKLPADRIEAIKEAARLLFPDDPVLSPYFANFGFRVTPEDARALADALERALANIPEHDALEDKSFEIEGVPDRLLPVGTPVGPVEMFSGENKQHLKEFVAFCRQGGFAIS